MSKVDKKKTIKNATRAWVRNTKRKFAQNLDTYPLLTKVKTESSKFATKAWVV